MKRSIRILGTRGIPAAHGGFETFAEHLAPYLASRGWDVTVYCQEDSGEGPWEDAWKGVRLVHIPVRGSGALGTIIFDARSTMHAARRPGLVLTLGYNTAIFGLLYRLRKIPNVMNMDGIEWKRDKWSPAAKLWLYLNERVGCRLADHLIADHPDIKRHLARKRDGGRITVIPYGADPVDDADASVLDDFSVAPNGYCLVIARPEKENSILEIVSAFSKKRRGVRLLVLGAFDPEAKAYHREVIGSASDEVAFPGAIYDRTTVGALRRYCRLYIHGHRVGGTNPSLVEALGAGTPVLAHDNRFNRWVAGEGAAYFKDAGECALMLDSLLGDDGRLEGMGEASLRRFRESFTWDKVLSVYEEVLLRHLP